MGECIMKYKLSLLILSLLLVSSLFVSCTKDSDLNDFADGFNFHLDFGMHGQGSIDTYKNKLTKDLVANGQKSVNFVMPTEYKERIYQMFLQYDIESFPEDLCNYEADNGLGINPSSITKFTYTLNGKTKTIKYDDAFGYQNEPENLKTFKCFTEEIIAYIYNTDAYKNMPQASGFYL
jgi:hypothetical protein